MTHHVHMLVHSISQIGLQQDCAQDSDGQRKLEGLVGIDRDIFRLPGEALRAGEVPRSARPGWHQRAAGHEDASRLPQEILNLVAWV